MVGTRRRGEGGGGLLIQFDASVNLHGIALERRSGKERAIETDEGRKGGRKEGRSETDREKVESVSASEEGTKSVIPSDRHGREVKRSYSGPT